MMMERLRALCREYERLVPRHKVGVMAEIAAGAWYPLAGFILWLVFRARGSKRVFRAAPLAGAVCSLALFTVQFALTFGAGA